MVWGVQQMTLGVKQPQPQQQQQQQQQQAVWVVQTVLQTPP
jgi:hypothetical protein